MARVSTYLNFPRCTEEAFQFYQGRLRDRARRPGCPIQGLPRKSRSDALAEADKDLVMHVELPILGGHVLMGTDGRESMGFAVTAGNNVHINLEPDTRRETARLFDALAAGGTVEVPLQDMFWGGYFGSLTDRFGIRWMFNCASKT